MKKFNLFFLIICILFLVIITFFTEFDYVISCVSSEYNVMVISGLFSGEFIILCALLCVLIGYNLSRVVNE